MDGVDIQEWEQYRVDLLKWFEDGFNELAEDFDEDLMSNPDETLWFPNNLIIKDFADLVVKAFYETDAFNTEEIASICDKQFALLVAKFKALYPQSEVAIDYRINRIFLPVLQLKIHRQLADRSSSSITKIADVDSSEFAARLKEAMKPKG